MEDALRKLWVNVDATWRHRWLAALVAWLVGLVGAGVVLKLPDKYEAKARVYVDTQSMLKPLMQGLAIQPNVDQQVSMLSRTLVSRPNIEKLIRMADLDLKIDSRDQEALIDRLMKTLEIKGTTRDNLYTVAYRDEDPERAKRVVQSLLSIFVESSLGDKRKDSDSAKRFIDDQIKDYEKKLEDAEARLKEFKMRNIEMQFADGKPAIERLSDIASNLNAATLALREATNSRDALKRQLTADGAAGSSDLGGAVPEIDGRLDGMKRTLDLLMQRYTENHPDVIATRRSIRELEEQRRAEIDLRKKAAIENPSVAVSNSVASQQLRVAFSSAESNVASLQARVAEYQARMNKARDGLRLAPQIESEYVQLNRDYETHRKNYEQLVGRRESAKMSSDLDSASAIANFRVIDPPRADPKPVAPNRLLLLPAALAIALVAGFAAAFVASQIRPVFLDSRSLREATGLAFLGSVTMFVSDDLRRERRRSNLKAIAAFAALAASYATGMAAVFWMSWRITG